METIFFHELENHKRDLDQFVRRSKTWLFMHGLRKLREALEKEKLSYFWHSRLNLFEKMSSATMQNHANRIRNIIDEIDNKIDNDKLILARKILTAHESNYLLRANFRVVYQNYNNRYHNRRRKDDNEFNNMILVFFIILIIWILNQDQGTSTTT
uniref:Mab-21-like HhH/H2TH-like domain-containing protein n=1 Tax=Trichogramma kaykai TaxID=54128 RepID=A0ABD2W232_9HYME